MNSTMKKKSGLGRKTIDVFFEIYLMLTIAVAIFAIFLYLFYQH